MTDYPRTLPAEKVGLHPRNKHRGRYDFVTLIQASPALAQYVKINAHNDASIDFANPQTVKALNSALLKYFYNVIHWDIPAQYLCPPIPGRADYLHYMADLLASVNASIIPTGNAVRVLDIGVGANAIYPLIGQREYGWHFVGADIDPAALENAQHVLDTNSGLSSIELRLQPSSSAIFKGLVKPDEKFDLTMCNPPFHASLHEARAGTERKLRNLGKMKASSKAPVLNFGGQAAELYCAGGEEAFVTIMVNESRQIAQQCLWFTTLISKASSLPSVYRALKNVNALQVKTIDMAQGQKKSRVVAWTFMNASQQRAWYANNHDSP
jgi:23S rRNA (adenine1618-N6)-methyltransferase